MEHSFHNKSRRATLINTTSEPIYIYTLYFNVNSLPSHKLVCKKTRCRCWWGGGVPMQSTHTWYTKACAFVHGVEYYIIRSCLRVYIGEEYQNWWIRLALGELKTLSNATWFYTNATAAPFKVCYVIQTSFFKQRNNKNTIQYLTVKWHSQVNSFDKDWLGTTLQPL